MTIIQGSNDPVAFEITDKLAGASDLSAALSISGKIVKSWRKADVEIDRNILSLPLKESETLCFGYGAAKIEIKFYIDGRIIFAESVPVSIIGRLDKTQLSEE